MGGAHHICSFLMNLYKGYFEMLVGSDLESDLGKFFGGMIFLIGLNRSLNLKKPSHPPHPNSGNNFFLAISCRNRSVCDVSVPRDLNLEQFWS